MFECVNSSLFARKVTKRLICVTERDYFWQTRKEICRLHESY
jgi:hypothetical protein